MSSKVIGAIIAVVVLAGAALYLTGSRKSTQNITSQMQVTGQPQAAQNGNRQTVDCSIYGQKTDLNKVPADLRDAMQKTQDAMHYVKNDMGQLPKDFPTAPNSTLCGTDSSLSSTYYISSLSIDGLFTYYKKTLTARSCTVSDVIKGQSASNMYYITFTCNGTKGLISPDPYRMAYGIVYPSR